MRESTEVLSQAVRFLRLSGALTPEMELVVKRSYLTTSPRRARDIPDSRLQVEMRDANDALLLRWGLHVLEPRRGRLSTAIFRSDVPFPRSTARVAFVAGGRVLYSIDVPKHGPRFVEGVNVDEVDSESYVLRWKAEHPDGLPMRCFVRASADGGRTWLRLASGRESREKNERIVAKALLAGGNDCVVEIVASDGVNVERSRARVPNAPPLRIELVLLSPSSSGVRLMTPVRLRALASVVGVPPRAYAPATISWYADGVLLGAGQVRAWRDADPGPHTLRCEATAGDLRAVETIAVEVATTIERPRFVLAPRRHDLPLLEDRTPERRRHSRPCPD